MRTLLALAFSLSVASSLAVADGRVSIIIPENTPFTYSESSTKQVMLSLHRDVEGYVGNSAETFKKPEISLYDPQVPLSSTEGSYVGSLECFQRFLNNAMNNREKPGKGQKYYFVVTFSRANIVDASENGRIGLLRIDRNNGGEQSSITDCSISNSLADARKVAATRFVSN
ncbi:MAG: hypothetical protein J0M12_16940 [Deltaproteobacteria bacterium]|nr:hypothetical protein [Deltaproteobacteria bacterium]